MYQVSDQSGRRFVITGANSGTGKEATRRIAAAGGHVVMAVRTEEKGHAAAEEIRRDVPTASLEVRRIDLADLASVHAFADGLLADGHPVDVLINNAGVMAVPNRTLTADGFELQLGSNFLGPFALTNRLLPFILSSESAQPRIVTMASGAANMGSIHFRDLQFAQSYSSVSAYAQSKLADLLLGLHLSRIADERGWNLLSAMAHPGYTRTNLQSVGPNLGRAKKRFNPMFDLPLLPSQDVVSGTEPLLFAATDPTAEQGAYYGPRYNLVGPTKKVALPRSARGVDLASSLWSVAEDLTGTSLPVGIVTPSR